MAMMNRLKYRKKLRVAIQDTLNVIIQDIKEDVIAIGTKRHMKKHNWVVDKELSLLKEPDTEDPLLKEPGTEDPSKYFSELKMPLKSFTWLQNKLETCIEKSDTVMRQALPVSLKLQIVLHMLTTGSSLKNLESMFGVSTTSISFMIPAVCDAICYALNDYITVPKNKEEWTEVGVNFSTIWNFHGCCGALDGKQIVMKFIPGDAEDDDSSNSNVDIDMLAVCDANYCFKYIDFVRNKRKSPEGSFLNSNMYVALKNNLLPENHVFVADPTFPLEKYLMIPYAGNEITDREKVFNYRLSRAKSVIENAFGMLVSRFRIFEKPIPFVPDETEKIIKACCALHNWLRMSKIDIEVTTVDLEDIVTGNFIPGAWRDLVTEGLVELPRNLPNNASQDGHWVRDTLARYFDGTGPGAVSWQWRMIYY